MKSSTRGFVVFVGAGPGQADLITLRGAERLRSADVVLFDSLADPALRALAPDARWIDVGKRGFRGVPHPMPGESESAGQATINALLVKHAS
jgi:uroporphyrin-III C-methyltransferase